MTKLQFNNDETDRQLLNLRLKNTEQNDKLANMEKRLSDAYKKIDELVKQQQTLEIQKVDMNHYNEAIKEVQLNQNRCEAGQDKTKADIKTIEHYIDIYVPIRIAKQIEEFLVNTLPER